MEELDQIIQSLRDAGESEEFIESFTNDYNSQNQSEEIEEKPYDQFKEIKQSLIDAGESEEFIQSVEDDFYASNPDAEFDFLQEDIDEITEFKPGELYDFYNEDDVDYQTLKSASESFRAIKKYKNAKSVKHSNFGGIGVFETNVESYIDNPDLVGNVEALRNPSTGEFYTFDELEAIDSFYTTNSDVKDIRENSSERLEQAINSKPIVGSFDREREDFGDDDFGGDQQRKTRFNTSGEYSAKDLKKVDENGVPEVIQKDVSAIYNNLFQTDENYNEVIIPRVLEQNSDAFVAIEQTTLDHYGIAPEDFSKMSSEDQNRVIAEITNKKHELLGKLLEGDEDYVNLRRAYSEMVQDYRADELNKLGLSTNVPEWARGRFYAQGIDLGETYFKGVFQTEQGVVGSQASNISGDIETTMEELESLGVKVQEPTTDQQLKGEKVAPFTYDDQDPSATYQIPDKYQFTSSSEEGQFAPEEQNINDPFGFPTGNETTIGERRDFLINKLNSLREKSSQNTKEGNAINKKLSYFNEPKFYDEDGTTFADVLESSFGQMHHSVNAIVAPVVGSVTTERGTTYSEGIAAIAESKGLNPNNPEDLLKIIESGEDERVLFDVVGNFAGALESVGQYGQVRAFLKTTGGKKVLMNLIRKEYKKALKQAARKGGEFSLQVLNGQVVEGVTERVQEGAQMLSRVKATDSWRYYSRNQLNEATTAAFFSSGLTVFSGKFAKGAVDTALNVANPKFREAIKEELLKKNKQEVEIGVKTEEEGATKEKEINKTADAYDQLPDNLSSEDKKKAVKILKEIGEIDEKVSGKNKDFFKKEVERKKVLQERLTNLSETANYVDDDETLFSDTENETREQDAGTQPGRSDRNVLEGRDSDGKALQGDTDNVGTTKTEKGPIGKTQDDTGGLGEASVGKTKPDNARTAGVQELQPGTDKPTQNRRHQDLQSSLGYETEQKGGTQGTYSIPITQTGRFGVQQVPITIDLQSIYSDKDNITNPQVQALKDIYEKNWGIKTVALDFDTFNNGSLKGSEGVSFISTSGEPVIGLNKDGFSKDTPIHEMGHFIIPLIRKNNPALYEAFKDKLLNSEEGKPFRDQLAARKSEGNYTANNAEQDVQELMSISLGQIGYETNKGKDNQSALIKLAEQILNFFKDVLKSLGYDIDSIRSKKPGKLTLGDIANVINAEAKSPGTILKGKFSKEDVARAKIEESSNLTENSVGGFKIKETTTALGGKLIIPEGFKIEELPFQGKEVTERMKEALENDIPSAQSQLGERKEHTSRKRGVQPKKTPEQEASDKRFAGVVEDVKQIQKDAKSLKRAHIKVTQNEDPKRVALAIANAFFGKKGKLNGERLQGVARKIGKAAIPKDHKFKDEKTRRMAEGQIGMRYLDPFIYHSENNPEGWLDLEVEVSRGKRGALDEKFNIIVKKPAALNEFLVGAAFGINVENHSTAQSEPEVYGDDNKNQHGNHQIPRADESVKDDQDPQVKDNINKLNGVGYTINEDILVVFENKLQKLIDEINAKNFTDEKKNAKIKRAKRALALARSLVGRTFYVGNHYDFRGRIIAAIEGLNFQGTKMELALFQQANPKGKPIGAEGLKRLIIDSGDTLGGVEGSSDIDRLNYGLANLPAIVEMTNDLIKNDQWSNETKVDEPHLHASAALELRKALELDDPTSYVSGHVAMEDASSSAIQIWSRHLRLEDVADMVNAGTSLEQGDFYNQLADNTFSKLTTPTEPELETFNRIQPEYDRQRKNIEKTYQQQRKDKNFKKEEGVETPLQQAWREFKEWRADNRKDLDTTFRIYWSLPKRLGKIRKLAKGPGFTRYYMATPLSMTDNMVSDFQGEPLFDGMYWDHASWLVKKLNEEAIKLANPIEIAKEQISLLGEVKGRRGESLTWTAPGGFKVVQNPREAITQGVKWRFPGDNKRVLNRPSRKGADNEILNPTYVVGDGGIKVTGKGGMKSSGPANFIQSGDAGVKQWLLTNTDIDLTQIFDNFGTLLADADQLSIFLRMAYVDLFTPDHVKNLFYENLPEAEAKEMHDKIPYGTMKADDNTIIKNPHTFSAGTFKPKVDVQHLRELNTKEIFETYEDLVSETEGFLLNDKIEEIEEKQKPC